MGIFRNAGDTAKDRLWDRQYNVRFSGKKIVAGVAALTLVGAYNAADGDPQQTGNNFGRGMTEHAVDGVQVAAPVAGALGAAAIGTGQGVAEGVDINVDAPNLNFGGGSYTVQAGDSPWGIAVEVFGADPNNCDLDSVGVIVPGQEVTPSDLGC